MAIKLDGCKAAAEEAANVRPSDWDGFLVALAEADVPLDFLDEREHNQAVHRRDPLEGWAE